MKKIKSIFWLYLVFLIMTVAAFVILSHYSTASLRESLMEAAKIQLEYSCSQLDQKTDEFEIDADGVLHCSELKTMQLALTESDDVYDLMMGINALRSYLQSRQNNTGGIAEYILYWPEYGRIVTTASSSGGISRELLENAQDNTWLIWEKEVYFVRKYETDWDETDDEPMLLLKMERDFLYKIRSIAAGMQEGGTILSFGDGESLFSLSEQEGEILNKAKLSYGEEKIYTLRVGHGEYQVLKSEPCKNGISLISWYPLKILMKDANTITYITGGLLMLFLAAGGFFIFLYYQNVLLQLQIITKSLQEMEKGNLSVRIEKCPDNEFGYVFGRFNQMAAQISRLLDATVREQKLRSEAELAQLQLQINPHFLYNSLSYIVTVADRPEAVTQMAVHLANYYRYCTKHRTSATIGEEVFYAKAYLEIMRLRKNIDYSVTVPQELMDVSVLPLILQPVIENAIEHAIEKRENASQVHTKIYRIPDGGIRFEICDDGYGMTQEEIRSLKERLSRKKRMDGESVGLWNVNQRLVNFYGQEAELKFGKSMWGGLSVSFRIAEKEGWSGYEGPDRR